MELKGQGTWGKAQETRDKVQACPAEVYVSGGRSKQPRLEETSSQKEREIFLAPSGQNVGS